MALEFKRLPNGGYNAKIGYGYNAIVCKDGRGGWTWGVFKGADEVAQGADLRTMTAAKRAAYDAASGITIKETNLMSGKEFDLPITTPWCCNPGSETYWSM